MNKFLACGTHTGATSSMWAGLHSRSQGLAGKKNEPVNPMRERIPFSDAVAVTQPESANGKKRDEVYPLTEKFVMCAATNGFGVVGKKPLKGR